jgi:hypothetical protein
MTLLQDVEALRVEVDRLAEVVNTNKDGLGRHEEQINGERGLSAAIKQLSEEVRGLRRAAYWVAGLIVAGSITFAFSVLAVVGNVV